MRKVEYKTERYKQARMGAEHFTFWLNRKGLEGWHLVFTQEVKSFLGKPERVCIFSREVKEAPLETYAKEKLLMGHLVEFDAASPPPPLEFANDPTYPRRVEETWLDMPAKPLSDEERLLDALSSVRINLCCPKLMQDRLLGLEAIEPIGTGSFILTEKGAVLLHKLVEEKQNGESKETPSGIEKD